MKRYWVQMLAQRRDKGFGRERIVRRGHRYACETRYNRSGTASEACRLGLEARVKLACLPCPACCIAELWRARLAQASNTAISGQLRRARALNKRNKHSSVECSLRTRQSAEDNFALGKHYCAEIQSAACCVLRAEQACLLAGAQDLEDRSRGLAARNSQDVARDLSFFDLVKQRCACSIGTVGAAASALLPYLLAACFAAETQLSPATAAAGSAQHTISSLARQHIC